MKLLTAGKYCSLRRLADENGFFKMTAVDQRPPIMNLITSKRGVSQASYEDVALVKTSLTKILAPQASAMLLDPIWAYPKAHQYVSPKQGLIITIEEHEFYEDDKGRRSSNIADWTVAKIKSMGADAVKALAWYRPDGDPETALYQQKYVQDLGDACKKYDICFLFELLVYPLKGEADQTTEYIEHASKHPQNVIDSVKVFADPKFGIDIFKLESPIPASKIPDLGEEGSELVQSYFDEINRISPVPWVMLSAGADMAAFERVMKYAYKAGASGYLAGRAIWLDAAQHFPDMSKLENALQENSVPYMKRLNKMTDEKAISWFNHRSFGGSPCIEGLDQDFVKNYKVEF